MHLRGRVRATLRRKGKVILVREGSNLVVSAGKNLLANIVESAAPARPSHMALGSGSMGVTEADTALEMELTRVALTSTTRLDNEITYQADFFNSAHGPWTVNEAGIFNTTPGGTMLARWLTLTFSMDTGDQLEVKWTLTFG